MGFDPHNYLLVKQYGILTGQYEATLSGQIHVDDEVLSFYPYDTLPLNKYFEVTVKKGLSSTGEARDLAEDYKFYFTSRLHPMYSSYVLVRTTGGAFLDLVPQDIINREIHYYSLLIDSIAPEAVAGGYWYVTKYVTCRTAYSLLSGAIQKLIINGYRSKSLGDLTIEANTDIKNAVSPKLDELKACLEETANLIANGGKRYPEALTGVRSQAALTTALLDLTRYPLTTGRLLSEESIFGDIYNDQGQLITFY